MTPAVSQPEPDGAASAPESDGRFRQESGNGISEKHKLVGCDTVYHEALEEFAGIVPIASASVSMGERNREGGGNDGKEVESKEERRPGYTLREAGEAGEAGDGGGRVGSSDQSTEIDRQEPVDIHGVQDRQDGKKDTATKDLREVPSRSQPPQPDSGGQEAATTEAGDRKNLGTEIKGEEVSSGSEERAVSKHEEEVGLSDGRGIGGVGGLGKVGRTGWDGMGEDGSTGVGGDREEHEGDSNEGGKVNPPSVQSTVDMVEEGKGKSAQSMDVREGEGDVTSTNLVKREGREGGGGEGLSKNVEAVGMEVEKEKDKGEEK